MIKESLQHLLQANLGIFPLFVVIAVGIVSSTVCIKLDSWHKIHSDGLF